MWKKLLYLIPLIGNLFNIKIIVLPNLSNIFTQTLRWIQKVRKIHI